MPEPMYFEQSIFWLSLKKKGLVNFYAEPRNVYAKSCNFYPNLEILTPHFETSTPDLEISTPSKTFDKNEIAP